MDITLIAYLAVFFVSGLILSRSAALLITNFESLRKLFGITAFFVGFLVTALATTLPELFVGIASALNNQPQFALGTAIGSNIVDITLIAGIAIIFAGSLDAKEIIKKREGFYMLAIVILLILMLLDSTVSRFDGIILLIVYAIYVVHLLKHDGNDKQIIKNSKKLSTIEVSKHFILIIVGLIAMMIASEFVVKSSSQIAYLLNIPIILIGLVLVAIGTSIPELAISISASKNNAKGLILGGIMGSVVANSTLLIGIVALISPIKVKEIASVDIAIFFMLLAIIFFLWAMYSDRKFTKPEGVFLIIIYLIYICMGYLGIASF